jgi:Arc/MetJ-type ribon-helix-helix transcriptional regulator
MKLSISLTEDDVALLDQYAESVGLPSRSAAVHHAIHLLRQADLEDDYVAAWQDWDSSGENAAWQGAGGDGLADAAR